RRHPGARRHRQFEHAHSRAADGSVDQIADLELPDLQDRLFLRLHAPSLARSDAFFSLSRLARLHHISSCHAHESARGCTHLGNGWTHSPFVGGGLSELEISIGYELSDAETRHPCQHNQIGKRSAADEAICIDAHSRVATGLDEMNEVIRIRPIAETNQ